MRTQQEILERIEQVKENDFFGFQRTDLFGYLEIDYSQLE